MEEDIKVLEEFLSLKTIDNKIVFTEKFLEVFKEPIRNLVARNKDLENANKKLYELCQGKAMQEFINNECDYIPKSKVRVEIKELENRKNYKPLDNRYTYKEVIEFGIEELEHILQEGDDK